MAKKVFAVYLAKEDVPNSEAYATLELPASPWELWDAMEKVRLKDGEALYMEIDDYYAFEYLAPHLEELDISLNELNDLAARLATLDEVQGIAFEGLFSMEVQKKVNTNGGIITMQDINQRNEGIDLDGVSGALMATQNLQMQTFITNPGSSQSGPQKQIAFAANQRDEVRDLHDVAGALQAQPGLKQQTLVAGFSAGAGASAGTIGYQEDVSPTLKGSPSGNCMPSILCINDQGGQIMECSENVTGTLRAQEHGHQPLVLRPTGPKVYENHGIDGRYTGPHDVAPTMSARYGTGGNNIPLVQQEEVICIAGNAIDRQPQNGGNGFGWQQNISYTLTATDRHSVYARQRVDQFRDDEIASTESARQHKDATDLVCQPPSTWDTDCRNLIRRLTPLECERLQGYPDGWTDVPGASDSARYKALGNSVAIPCVEYLMQRVAMVITLDLEWDF